MESNEPAPLSKAAIVFGIIGYAAFLTYGIRYPSIAAQFRELFIGFGMDLSPATRLAIDQSLLISKAIQLIAGCEVILLGAYVVRRTSLIRRLIWAALVLDVVIAIGVMIPFYQPIFKLDSGI